MMTSNPSRIFTIFDVCVRCACRRGFRTKGAGQPKRPTRTTRTTNDPHQQTHVDSGGVKPDQMKSIKTDFKPADTKGSSSGSSGALAEGSTAGNKGEHLMKQAGGRSMGAENVVLKSTERVGLRRLVRPFLFTVGFSGCSFVGATIWQYEDMRNYAQNAAKTPYPDSQWHRNINQQKSGDLRKKVNELWNSFSEGEKTVIGIIALNIAVYMLWKVPALQTSMMKWFTCNPAVKGPVCAPMLLSTFSHYSAFHLAINMYVLWTFSPAVGSILGKEQFTAFYLSSGVISSFCSSLYKVSINRFYPSLGASGAILAVLGAVCTQLPDTRLSIVFLPFFTFSAGVALKGIIAIESLGIMLRWKLFDHAAHLGGLLCGSWYVKYGHDLIWAKRETIIMKWHNLRESSGKR